MKSKNVIYLFFAVLVITALACGKSNQGQKVGESGGNVAPTAAPSKAAIYKVGDVVQVEDHSIVLNSAEIQGDILNATFTIENKGTSNVVISSLMSFDAKGNDGIRLNNKWLDCGLPKMDDTVMPGDKLKGGICWKGLTTSSAKIYYLANPLISEIIVWEVKK